MYLTKDVPNEEYEPYNEPGFEGVLRRKLLNPENSSKQFALRTYIIDPNGHTALDRHSHEHGVYILSGELDVRVGDRQAIVRTGDVLHIASDEPHQFINRANEYAKFLCVRDFA
ncbi:MAG: cupin domain-containing protein [Candidatus Thorarchaeota archaeon]|nr:MAG: cupin domain-containing protein [Candidatus Thorarchaeota archaeon]